MKYKVITEDCPQWIPNAIHNMELQGYEFIQIISQIYRYGPKQHPVTQMLFKKI